MGIIPLGAGESHTVEDGMDVLMTLAPGRKTTLLAGLAVAVVAMGEPSFVLCGECADLLIGERVFSVQRAILTPDVPRFAVIVTVVTTPVDDSIFIEDTAWGDAGDLLRHGHNALLEDSGDRV